MKLATYCSGYYRLKFKNFKENIFEYIVSVPSTQFCHKYTVIHL